MERASDESRTLRRTMRDLVALSALPAVWAGYRPLQVAEGLAEVLRSTLRLDLIYIRLPGPTEGQGIEVARTAAGSTSTGQTRDIGRALAPWLDGADSDAAPLLPNPIGPGMLRVVLVPIGCAQQDGVLAAGSRQKAFPGEEERLLLSVGANQAAAVLRRERDEEALRESEQRWRSLTEALPQLVWSATPDGACDYFSAQWTEHTGAREAELLGWGWLQTLHPDDREPTRQFWLESVAGRHPYDVEYRVRRRDGEYRWFKTRGLPIRDGSGNIIKWFGTCTDITDLRRAEEALRQAHRELEMKVAERTAELRRTTTEALAAQQRFRDLVNSVEGIVWEADAETLVFSFVSEQANRILGYPVEQWLREPTFWKDHLHPEDRDRVVQFCQEATAEKRGHEFEYRMIAADGRAVWLRDLVTVVVEEGRATHLRGVMFDSTERKCADEALRKQADLLNLTHDAIFVRDMDGVITYWNHGAEALYGWPAEQAAGKTNQQLLRTAFPVPLEQIEAELLSAGRWEGELVQTKKDGSQVVVASRWSLQRDRCGAAVAVLETNNDITERKQAEEALRESEAKLEEAQRIAHVGYWDRDLDTNLITWSDETYRIFGLHPEERSLTFGRIQELIHRDDRERVLAAATEALQEGVRYDVEYRVIRPNGEVRIIHSQGNVTKDNSGQPRRLFGTVQDITERRAKEAAEAANRAKDEFLANVSHEIRTPMNAILGMTELVLETEVTDDQRQCLQTVKSAADNLLGIINDLLDFSKIEAGKMELIPADFSLRAAVGETLRALAERAHKKGLELISEVQPEVPDVLVGDAGRLRQVLLNLVGNAIKFTDTGEVEVCVEVSVGVAGDLAPEEVGLRFAVRDTGIGIPMDQQERIFRAFEQEDTSTTRRYGGTGLGLTISARLVALMGGTISVDSEPGRGSTFAFTARFRRQPHPPEPIPIYPPILLHNLPVLVIDDNATNRHILEEWLRGWQMQPAAVGDAVAALDALQQAAARGRPYPLVLLDARMPGEDGLSLAGQVRQQPELSATRIILLTSGDRPGDLARARELRINAHLLKPVQQDELLETIYQVMSRGNRDVPPAAKSTAEQEPTAVPAPAASSLRVLVAEDNEFNAQLLERLLGRRGHRVRLASNGREALALAGEGGFDVLLLDVHMPELDGFQVVQAVRERERTAGGHLPVVALTARARKEDRERCLAAGMDDFLAKPIQAADLWAAIDRVVGARPPPEPPRPGLFDPPVLLAACGGDAAILEKIGQAFRARLPDQLKAIQDALRDRNAPRLREAAHKLAGMVAAFSTVAGGVASDLEDQAAQGRLEEAHSLVARLGTMADELMRLVGGLSLEALRAQAGAGAEPGRTAGP